MAGRLPIVKVTDIGGSARLYYHDERLQELRDVRNPHRVIHFNMLWPALLGGLVTLEVVTEAEVEAYR